jgi:hypothetical protein
MINLLLSASIVGLMLPNPMYTIGVVNPNITQDNIHTTICIKGYTSIVRPPSAYTTALKKKQLSSYYADNCTVGAPCEEDHLIPLELGGHPTDEKNLWPQPSFHIKDVCENSLHRQVCSGSMKLVDAQQGIAKDWIKFCAAHP